MEQTIRNNTQQPAKPDKQPTYAPYVLWPWLILFIPQFIFLVIVGIANPDAEGAEFEALIGSASGTSSGYLFGILLGLPFLKLLSKTESWPVFISSLSFKSVTAKGLLLVTTFTLGYSVFEYAYGLLLEIPYPEFMMFIKDTTYGPTELLLVVLAICIAAPLWEEVLFRGYLYNKLSQGRLSPLIVNVLISLSFAVMHIQYELAILVMLFFFSLFLGYLRHRYNNLSYCVFAHFVMNSYATLYLYLWA